MANTYPIRTVERYDRFCGFTFIELLVTIVLIGIIMKHCSFAFPIVTQASFRPNGGGQGQPGVPLTFVKAE